MAEDRSESPPQEMSENAQQLLRARRDRSDQAEMDMTPMVDVTFLLLIFFMITAAFALQKAIEVPPSRQDESATTQTIDDLENDSIVIRIDGDNVYWVGCPSWPDERRAPSKQDMRGYVRDAHSGGSRAASLNKLLVQASGDAAHEYVVAALDAGSAVGVEEIRIMSYEDEF